MKTNIAFLFAFLSLSNMSARENKSSDRKNNSTKILLAVCSPGNAQTDLDINNVRTTILTGGDMWWDLNNAKYEIPKGSGKHSMFAGSLWIGGIDAGNQIRVASMTYRSSGVDFFSGPLDPVTVSTNSSTVCSDYDKHWKITKQEVADFISSGIETQNITVWPAVSIFGQPLAPYYDADQDGNYNPSAGDYPGYDFIGNAACDDQLFGDQTIFWVFNDKGNGNVHGESNASPIGLEIQAQAFAFATNNALNDATFYKYKIINRSNFILYNTYFGQWADSDLGYAYDDFVGCDVSRGLGFCYNGLSSDGSGQPGEYGANPPAIGIDFLQGPYADANGIDDTIDINDPGSASGIGYGDQIVDNERLGMSKFVYYINAAGSNGNPQTGVDFYNLLSGFWKDNTPIEFGGDGYNESSHIITNFMFPGTSDPLGFGTAGVVTGGAGAWSEETVPNLPDDRRFIQSAGPFTLLPGAINYVTEGVIWAKATSGGPLASVQKMKDADDLAQAAFNTCFTVVSSIKENEIKSEVDFYPNPFSETATLTVKGAKIVHLEIFNVSGQRIKTYSEVNLESLRIDKSGLNPGIYFYKLRDSKGKNHSGKFIVN
jgi:hypothetical protein